MSIPNLELSVVTASCVLFLVREDGKTPYLVGVGSHRGEVTVNQNLGLSDIAGIRLQVDWQFNNLVAKGSDHHFILSSVQGDCSDLGTVRFLNLTQIDREEHLVLLAHNSNFTVTSTREDVRVSHCDSVD